VIPKVKKIAKANTKSKQEIIEEIRQAANQVEKIYLASDPDREGEAIS